MITFITTILLHFGLVFPTPHGYIGTDQQASEPIIVQPEQKTGAKHSQDRGQLHEVVQHDAIGV